MLRKQFHYQDINMGNEDSFTLVFNEETAEFFVEHWWSHRKTGTQLEYGSENKKLSLSEFRIEHGRRFEKLIAMLRESGFEE